jgi:hypothetical protein
MKQIGDYTVSTGVIKVVALCVDCNVTT